MKRLPLLVFAIFLLASCATTTRVEYVDREIVRYETKEVHDTLREKTSDSVSQSIERINDTVYVTKYKEHIKYLYRNVYVGDTVYKDSIQTVYIEKTVEKTRIPKICWFAFILASAIIATGIYKLIKKVKSSWL